MRDLNFLNRLFLKSRTVLSQRLAQKNERFLAAMKEASVNSNCIIYSSIIHVSFATNAEGEEHPLPFQVAIHSQRGLGVIRWNTLDDALAVRHETAGNTPLTTFQSAKNCDLSMQAIIDLESLPLMIAMTRNLSLRLAVEAN